MPRIATCHVCHIIERLPDVHPKTPMVPARIEWRDGGGFDYVNPDTGEPVMVPQFDPMLEGFVEQHHHGMPDEMVTHGQQIQCVSVDQRTWDSMDMVTKIKTELQAQTDQVYEENQEHREAALQCFNAHGNPTVETGCRDYKDDSKMIGKFRYEVDGETITIPPDYRQYLCYLCPFQQAAVAVEIRRRKGAYDDQQWMKRQAAVRRQKMAAQQRARASTRHRRRHA